VIGRVGARGRRAAARHAFVIVLCGATSVALAACTSSAADPGPKPSGSAQASASASPSVSPSASYGIAALTGLPLSGPNFGQRPAIAVSITIAAGEPAPVGLDQADVVFEEVSAPGAHRLVAIYQSHDAAKIGPVGAPRPMDVRLLPPLRAVVANNGDPSRFANGLHAANALIDKSYPEDHSAYTSENGRLYTSTSALYTGVTGTPPGDLFSRTMQGLRMVTVGEKPTAAVTVTMPGEAPVVWNDDVTKRAFTRAAPAVTVTNLIVLIMPYRVEAESNKVGAPTVHTAEVFGNGQCLVASDGFSAPCTWNRDGAAKITLYVDGNGYPARLNPGPTWVMFAPPGSTIATT
jgi:DUF3048 family protein